MSKLKTLEDLKEVDRELSGCLTPEDGKEYNYSIGEPKYHTSYKINYTWLRQTAREWIKSFQNDIDFSYDFFKCILPQLDDTAIFHLTKDGDNVLEYWIKHFFNLEEE